MWTQNRSVVQYPPIPPQFYQASFACAKELNDLPNGVNVIKSRIMRLAGHVLRMGGNCMQRLCWETQKERLQTTFEQTAG